jgi:demethylmenaquinone methyltransferase/2-methoxy-6-polyprenyl-1,4-benzoquinol methylase
MTYSLNQAKTRLATSFGNREVSPEDKPKLVEDLFERVAARYDLMNDAMSGGLHRLWKAAMVDHLAPRPGMRMVDVAGGTGDIAFRVLDRLNARQSGGPAARPSSITVSDVNPAMLAVGRDRAIDRNELSALDWICADAQALPLPDSSVDAYTIAFGIRNVTHVDKALREARRVLNPGGRFLCLEFSALQWRALQPIYDAYSFKVVPWLGEKIADDREAYDYLVESIRKFPDQKTFGEMIEEAGLERVRCSNLTGGVVALHAAWRL